MYQSFLNSQMEKIELGIPLIAPIGDKSLPSVSRVMGNVLASALKAQAMYFMEKMPKEREHPILMANGDKEEFKKDMIASAYYNQALKDCKSIINEAL